MNLILASASSRRKELLEKLGLKFNIIVSNVDENITYNGYPEEYVKELAVIKARTVSKIVNSNCIIIGADTIVFYDGKILGKPCNEEDAFNMLKMLSGKIHTVYTGMAIISKDNDLEKITSFVSSTEVKMYELSDSEIKAYISTHEPMDKAGSYAIHEKGTLLIESISGNFNTVVGLNTALLYRHLKEYGIDIMHSWKK